MGMGIKRKKGKKAKQKQLGGSRISNENFIFESPSVTDSPSRQSPIMSAGSPRSKQDSSSFNSAGVFKYSNTKKWENYWGE